MSRYFVPLQQGQVRNSLIDFSPVNQGLNAIGQAKQQATQNALAERKMNMAEDQFAYQRGRDQKADAKSDVEWYGKQASAVDQMQGPQREAAWQRIISKHGAEGLTPEEMDPMTGPKLMMAQAGQFVDPMARETAQAKLGLIHAKINKMNRESEVAGKPTDDMREYNLSKSQGFTGTFLDFDKQRRSASAARTNINMPMETAYDKEMGKQLAGEYIKSQETAAKAAQAQGDLRVMQDAADNPAVYTGTGGNTIQGLKKAAQTLFGVDVQGVPEGELIQRTTAKIALSLKDGLPGPMSDSDRQFLMDLPAGLTTSPEGIRRVVKLGLAQRQWEIERAQAAQKFATQNGGRLTPEFYRVLSGVDQKWARSMSTLSRELQLGAANVPNPETSHLPTSGQSTKGRSLDLGDGFTVDF